MVIKMPAFEMLEKVIRNKHRRNLGNKGGGGGLIAHGY